MEIRCSFCKGTGHKHANYNYIDDICPVCDGVGKVDVPNADYECTFCKGTGHKHGNYNYIDDICPSCNGTGVKGIVKFG